MKKLLTIYGAGGLGREVLSMLRSLPEWEVEGFYDDHLSKGTLVAGKWKVLGGLRDIRNSTAPVNTILAMGSPGDKERICEALRENKNIRFVSLVHPSVILQDPDSIHIGEGCIVGAGTILTTSITVGDHVLINLNCTIGHDVQIGKFSSIMPSVNLSGDVAIGEGVILGSGATIINRVAIGSFSKIGAGAVVISSVPDGVTAVGVPARIIR